MRLYLLTLHLLCALLVLGASPSHAEEKQESQSGDSVCTLILVDKSRSMAVNDRLKKVVSSIHDYIDRLPNGLKFAVTGFDMAPFKVAALAPLAAHKKGTVKERVSRLYPVGATNFPDAGMSALVDLRPQQCAKHIQVISDGDLNGDFSEFTDALYKSGISISFFWIEKDMPALKKIAMTTGGVSSIIGDNTELTDILVADFENFLKRTKSSLQVTASAPKDEQSQAKKPAVSSDPSIHEVIQRESPPALRAELQAARSLLGDRKFKAALARFEEISDRNADQFSPLVYAAISRFLTNDFGDWKSERKHLEMLHAPESLLYYLDGFREAQMGNSDDAIDSFEDSIDADDGIPEVYYDLSVAYHDSGDYSEAGEVARKGLKKAPHNEHLMVALADSLQFSRNKEEAAEWYKKALAINPEIPSAESALCASLVNRGDFSEGVTHCEKAKKLSSGDGPAYFNAGKAYKALGNQSEAKKNYGKYVQMFGDKNPYDPFVMEAKSELSVSSRVEESRKSIGSRSSAPPPPYSDEENRLLNEIEASYSDMLGESEARRLVDTFRQLWAQIPRDERMKLMVSTRDQLKR